MTKQFNLEAEIRDFMARRDITDCVHRYMRGLDRLDAELQRSAFHDGAFVDVGLMAGPVDEFITFGQTLLATMDATHHLLGQIRIELNGDTAQGESYFQAWHGSHDEAGNPHDLFISGRYIDEYSCINGEWRITKRLLITDWVKDDPADHSFFIANPTNHRGGRRGEDFSETRNWPV